LRHAVALALALLLFGCSSDDPIEDPTPAEEQEASKPSADPTEEALAEPEYQRFEDVNTYTSSYFISLEDSPNLIEGHGEQAVWNYGVRVCRQLDRGETVEEQVEEMLEYEIDPSVVASAALYICEQHLPEVETFVAENS
jgi:hypothetical protein